MVYNRDLVVAEGERKTYAALPAEAAIVYRFDGSRYKLITSSIRNHTYLCSFLIAQLRTTVPSTPKRALLAYQRYRTDSQGKKDIGMLKQQYHSY